MAPAYANNLNCSVILVSQTTLPITISFDSNIALGSGDSLVVHDGDSDASPVLAAFTSSRNPIAVTGTSKYMHLRFVSDGGGADTGFSATMWASTAFMTDAWPGPQFVDLRRGYLALAASPYKQYPTYMDCTVVLTSATTLPITLTITAFGTEPCCDSCE